MQYTPHSGSTISQRLIRKPSPPPPNPLESGGSKVWKLKQKILVLAVVIVELPIWSINRWVGCYRESLFSK